MGVIPSEAIMGFASWLTCRKDPIEVGSTKDAAKIAELADVYIKENNLEHCREGIYPKNLKFPNL